MQTLLQDLRYAARQLWSSRGFTVLALLTLALGIGSNAALFTVVESVLLRPLPYAGADRLVHIGNQSTKPSFTSTSWLNYRSVQDGSHAFAALAGYSEDIGVIEGAQGAESVAAPHLTPNTFPMLGVHAALGRTFTEAEGQPAGAQVAILSDQLWRKSFHADPGVIGRPVKIGGVAHTVVGVMPAGFSYPEAVGADMRAGIWLPLQPTQEMLTMRGYNFFTIVGQLRPGVSLNQAQAELDAISTRFRKEDATDNADTHLRATPYQALLTGPVRPAFSALVAALALVLLIACANVANLLIARCLGRQQEFAVRVALGASRGRLVRQLLTEGALLSSFGCLAGLALAQLALTFVHKLPSDTIPLADSIAIRWPLLLVLAGIATLVTLLSSLLPALLAARTDPQRALQAASRGLGSRSGGGALSRWLVMGEVALATMLLIATGLLFHTLYNLEHAQLGFSTAQVSTFTALPADAAGFSGMAVSADTEHAPASVAALTYAPVLARMRALPGVEAAALITVPPLSGIDMNSSFSLVGRAKRPGLKQEARMTAVSAGYAQTMGIPMLQGRMIEDSDAASAPFIAVVNRTFAATYFGEHSPLGQQLDLGGKDTGMLKTYRIVGVIADQPDHAVGENSQPLILLPYDQVPTTSLFYQALLKTIVNFVVKTHGDIPLVASVRSIFQQSAPGYAVEDFKTMQQVVDDSMFSQRLGLYLTGAFAGLAVVMLAAGLYGVLAQLVSYRRHEFGIRMALGATRESLSRLVLRQGSLLIGVGLGAGLGFSLLLGRLVRSFLFGVEPADLLTYVSVAGLALLVGLAASLLPALRAASIEPMEALREE